MKLPAIFHRRWFIFILIIVLIFGAYYYFSSKNKNGSMEEFLTVEKRSLQEYVSSQGKIAAGSQATLKFQTGGKIIWIGAKKGDYVKKWQTIASLDQADLQARFKKALLSYQTTRLTFDQTLDDNQPGIAGRNHLDIQTVNDESLSLMRLLQKNQISLDQAIADVEIANIAKQYGSLYSPIDGILITATDENPGVNVSATTQYVVVDPNSLRFEAEIEEVDVVKIQPGMTAQITFDALPDQPFTTTVSHVEFNSTTTSTGNTAYKVYLPLALDNRFRLDLSGTAEILTSEKANVLAVASQAVLEDDNGRFVIIKNGNKYEKNYVKTGIETDDYYEIVEGLSEGQSVVTPNPTIEKLVQEAK